MNYLYHVDLLRSEEEIKEFTPKIPENRLNGENGTIKRICVANTIGGCLGSAPWGGRRFEELAGKQVFRVYKFNTKDIEEGNLITDKELYQTGFVKDAEIYGEHWIVNQNIKPCEVFYIVIEDYWEESRDLIDYNVLKSLEDDNCELDYEDCIDGCCTVYNDVIYSIIDKDKLQFGDELHFKLSELKSYIDKDVDNQELINKMVNLLDADYLSVRNDVKDISIQEDNLTFNLKLVNGLWYSDFINELKREFEI